MHSMFCLFVLGLTSQSTKYSSNVWTVSCVKQVLSNRDEVSCLRTYTCTTRDSNPRQSVQESVALPTELSHGVHRKMVLVDNFFEFFKLLFFYLLLIYTIKYTMWRLYMAFLSCYQHLEIFSEIWVMPMKLQNGITHISEKISRCW